MPEFVIFLRPRPGAPRPDEDEVRAHCARLQQLAREGRCVAAGPFEDGSGGMIVGTWSDEDEARAFAMEDPFVLHGREDVEVRPWSWSRPENGQLGVVDPAPGALPWFLDTVRMRWTCRDFDPARELSRDEVLELVEVGLQAPTEFNLQPVRPVVCHALEDRRRLRAACWDQAQVEECALAVVAAADPVLLLTEIPRTVDQFITRGRFPEEARAEREAFMQNHYREHDPAVSALRCASIFGQQLLLAGLARGLASCWIAGFEEAALREALELPERVAVAGVVLLGWPRTIGAPMPRRPLAEALHWSRWSEPA